jgi:predicted SnoaL-like aldol condensation-catalyzing enzyme
VHTAEEQANIAIVRRVYAEILDRTDPDAVDALIAPGYIQHNPNAATGAEGLKAMLRRARLRYPEVRHDVKRILADGDMVAAHVHVRFQPDSEGFATVDIFRFSEGRIVEHWDVMQAVPTTESQNDNGMF